MQSRTADWHPCGQGPLSSGSGWPGLGQGVANTPGDVGGEGGGLARVPARVDRDVAAASPGAKGGWRRDMAGAGCQRMHLFGDFAGEACEASRVPGGRATGLLDARARVFCVCMVRALEESSFPAVRWACRVAHGRPATASVVAWWSLGHGRRCGERSGLQDDPLGAKLATVGGALVASMV